MGWFYGFKQHLVINPFGEILSFMITPGNVDDRDFSTVSKLTKNLFGKLFGDRGYISQSLFELAASVFSEACFGVSELTNIKFPTSRDSSLLAARSLQKLFSRGLSLFTRIKSNMKNKLLMVEDKLLLGKRALIESVNERLKEGCQIEHTRHRSPIGSFCNLLSGIAAYAFMEKKLSIAHVSDLLISEN